MTRKNFTSNFFNLHSMCIIKQKPIKKLLFNSHTVRINSHSVRICSNEVIRCIISIPIGLSCIISQSENKKKITSDKICYHWLNQFSHPMRIFLILSHSRVLLNNGMSCLIMERVIHVPILALKS